VASSALAGAVFAVLDVADVVLCLVYALLDGILEESPVRCYCHRRSHGGGDEEEEVSDTLYARRSAIRGALLGLLGLVVRRSSRAPPPDNKQLVAGPCRQWRSPRWSDCGCKSCVAWRGSSSQGGGRQRRLHVVVKEPEPAAGTRSSCRDDDDGTTTTENNTAIFVHGFASSSSLWAETVFRESSSSNILSSSRLVAVDLLGFGQSPKPGNCMYTLKDHVEAIETSLLELDDDEPQQKQNSRRLMTMMSSSSSFHLVAHSMGCIIALALAAKHPTRVKSITLLAPPYFLACDGQQASQVALSRLAEKKLWPPLLLGSAVMSWYEHVGRTVCLLVCRNHRLWECLIGLLTKRDDVDFRVRDLTRHTHHSAWHTMHNVICGAAMLQDSNLEAVEAAGIPVMVIHGLRDPVVPVQCSRHLKAKLPHAELRLMPGCDHATVLSGREREFAEELTAFWSGHQQDRYDDDVSEYRGYIDDR